MKKSVLRIALLLALGAVVAVLWVKVSARAASAEPKLETQMSEIDLANFRADVAEINTIVNVQLAPLRVHAQGILDKYKLQLDQMNKTWGVDATTRQIQRTIVTSTPPPPPPSSTASTGDVNVSNKAPVQVNGAGDKAKK